MKFVIRAIGWEAFRAHFEEELEGFRREGGARLPFDPARRDGRGCARLGARCSRRRCRRSRRWRATPMQRSRRASRHRAAAAAAGCLSALDAQKREPAEAAGLLPRDRAPAARRFHGGTDARARRSRRGVRRRSDAPDGGAERALPLGEEPNRWSRSTSGSRPRASTRLMRCTLSDVVSCPGAESCRLAVTQSRGLGRVLTEYFSARPDLVDLVPSGNIKISGCPNGCGQHHIGSIGFQGSVRKVGRQSGSAVLRARRRRQSLTRARTSARSWRRFPLAASPKPPTAWSSCIASSGTANPRNSARSSAVSPRPWRLSV